MYPGVPIASSSQRGIRKEGNLIVSYRDAVLITSIDGEVRHLAISDLTIRC